MIEKVSINALSFSFFADRSAASCPLLVFFFFSYGLLVLYIFLYNLQCKKNGCSLTTSSPLSPFHLEVNIPDAEKWGCGSVGIVYRSHKQIQNDSVSPTNTRY